MAVEMVDGMVKLDFAYESCICNLDMNTGTTGMVMIITVRLDFYF